MQNPTYFEIRCPFQRLSKQDGKLYDCNSLCVKVTAGSAGEARCRKCHLNFEFEVDSRARRMTGVRVQRLEEQQSEQNQNTTTNTDTNTEG